MLLYSERLDDGGSETESGAAPECFGQGALSGDEDLLPLAAMRFYAAIPNADARRNCHSEPPPGRECTAAADGRRSSKPRIVACFRAIVLAASAVALTFWMARAPSSLPALQAGASEAPPDLATLALDDIPVVAGW